MVSKSSIHAQLISKDPISVEWWIEQNQKTLMGAGQLLEGNFSTRPHSEPSQFFDLASLSKPILTSTLLMETLVENFGGDWGKFLNLNLRNEIPELSLVPDTIDLRLRSLWEHRSGLPAHFSLAGDLNLRQRFAGSRSTMWGRLVSRICEELRHRKTQSLNTEYSDVGFWILGLWLERKHAMTLSQLWTRWKLKFSINEFDLVFESQINDSIKARLNPSESRHPLGEINDDNGFWMGSESPHAGLFGSVEGVAQWLSAVKKWAIRNPDLKFWINRETSSPNRFWLGWDTASGELDSQAGSLYAPGDCLGHLGWTGTAFWWSQERDTSGILLTNRVFPQHTIESQKWIRDFRKQFFSDLWQSKIEARWLP